MPSLLAPPSPAKNESGMLITSAQGQLITRNVRALYIHSFQSGDVCSISIENKGGMTASASAENTTAGV